MLSAYGVVHHAASARIPFLRHYAVTFATEVAGICALPAATVPLLHAALFERGRVLCRC